MSLPIPVVPAGVLVVSAAPACDVGCCLVTFDNRLGMGGQGNYARPMFQVIPDEGNYGDSEPGPQCMTVTQAEYGRPDRIFL